MSSRPVFLDVDTSIVKKNLRMTKESEEEELNKLWRNMTECPTKLIKPIPGFCIKTKEVGIDQKIFVNICQTDALPPPEDITETELVRLCDSDEPCNFKIPVSIGEIRLESDKKGNDAKTIDVAINSNFFKKIENNLFLRNFLLAVVFESLSDKHHLYVTDERIVLKNRKCYGNLQLHRIQQIQKIDEHVSEGQSNDVLISSDVPSQPKIEIISSSSHEEDESVNIPKYRLFRKVNEPNILYGEFELPYLKNSAGLSLDIGEDRIILDCKILKYFLDIYLPYDVISETAAATFSYRTKILTIKMSTV